MSAIQLPKTYQCPECDQIFEGEPRQLTAWIVEDVDYVVSLRADATFKRPQVKIVYGCPEDCVFDEYPLVSVRWKCRNCGDFYEDEEEAAECCD